MSGHSNASVAPDLRRFGVDLWPTSGPVLAGPAESCQDGGMAPSDLARLATAARKRRRQLGLALNDLNAKAGGTSKGTWQRVEKGEAIRATNYVKIDGLLQWAPGSCIAVLEGGEAVSVDPSKSEPGTVISELSPERKDAEARDVVQLAVVATTNGLTSEEIRALSDRAVRDLRAAGLM